MIILSASWRK